jgi:hypothetical protein
MSASDRIPGAALIKATCHVTHRASFGSDCQGSNFQILLRKARSSETSELNTIGTAHSVDFISQNLSPLFSFLFSLCPILLAVYGVR